MCIYVHIRIWLKEKTGRKSIKEKQLHGIFQKIENICINIYYD